MKKPAFKPFNLTVMMYHYVRDLGDKAEAGSGILGMPLARFETQIDLLSQRHTIVTWSDVQRMLMGGEALPNRACLLTFDDGTCDHYINVFPTLRKRGLSGLFFTIARTPEEGLVVGHKIHFLLATLGLGQMRAEVERRLTPGQLTRYQHAKDTYRSRYSELDMFKAILQRDLSTEAGVFLSEMIAETIGPEDQIARGYYLSPEQIAEMSASGMHFGGHSHSHPWFDWISSDQRLSEVNASAADLKNIEAGGWPFAYPYGGLSDDMPQYLEDAGFAAAFTTKPTIWHINPFYIGRLDGEDLSPKLDNLSLLARAS